MVRLSLRRWRAAACLLLAAGGVAATEVAVPSQEGRLQLTGHWFPAAAAGPRPAVVALHGCNGLSGATGALNGSWRRQAGYFNAEGMHLLVLDSFGPRGLGPICNVPNARRTLTEEDRRDDVFAALGWLAAQPDVDASRLVVAGWSHGAQAVLSAVDATQRTVQAQAVQPRAAVAFYPGCGKVNRMAAYRLTVPLLVMSGELDDWTPAAGCRALQARLAREGGPPMALEVYPDSHHGFDSLGPVRTVDAANTRSGKASVGGNPQALALSHARTFDFLAVQLGLPLAHSHEQRLKASPAR